MSDRKDEIRKKLSKLVQFRKNPDKLEEAVEKKYAEEVFKSDWAIGLDIEDEKTMYFEIVQKYLAAGEIEINSDKELLKQLCYLELINYRIRKALNEYAKNNINAPYKDLDNLNKNLEQIIKVKKQLGLASDEDEKTNDMVKVMTNLQTRFKKWINKADNRANYTTKCPYCKELYLIRRRVDKELDVILEHPWFVKGGLLFNKEIFQDLISGRITKEQVIRYLDITEDYLDWLYKNYRLELFENKTSEE